MSQDNKFTPRNIIQAKYFQTKFWLIFTALLSLTVISVLMLSILNLSLGTSDIVVYSGNSPTNLSATVVEPVVKNEEMMLEGADGSLDIRPLPTKISIPSINLETNFVAPLGVNNDNEIEVPDSYTDVGWYEHGPTPGDLGPAIILGHVDSIDGPAVLYNLRELEPGDSIYVERDDGISVRFVVESLEELSQDSFPTDQVYQELDYAGLKIITCSGTYQESELRYTHNLVVTARMVGLDFENTLTL